MADQLLGFIWGIVVENRDPLGMGRVLVRVDNLFEPHHPEWASPVGWPASGEPSKGTYFSMNIGAQVILLFEHGDMSAPPVFLPGPQAAADGFPDAPSIVQELFLKGIDPVAVAQSETPEEALRSGTLDEAIENVLALDVLWEDENFVFYVTSKDGDKRFVIAEKNQRAFIVMNATDGAQRKSTSISIFSNTSISIESKGTIDINAMIVQIQGRRVLKKPGVTTI